MIRKRWWFCCINFSSLGIGIWKTAGENTLRYEGIFMLNIVVIFGTIFWRSEGNGLAVNTLTASTWNSLLVTLYTD